MQLVDPFFASQLLYLKLLGRRGLAYLAHCPAPRLERDLLEGEEQSCSLEKVRTVKGQYRVLLPAFVLELLLLIPDATP